MSAHTPGPWVRTAVDGGWDAVSPADHRILPICRLVENNPANANLITAAPDMLSALSTIAALSRAIDDNSQIGGASDALFMAVDLARNAIAKARGEAA